MTIMTWDENKTYWEVVVGLISHLPVDFYFLHQQSQLLKYAKFLFF